MNFIRDYGRLPNPTIQGQLDEVVALEERVAREKLMIKVKESELEERKSEIETLEKKIADRDKIIGFY